MTKQKIKRALERIVEGQAFITASKVAKAMEYKTVYYVKNKYLKDLDRVNGKLYLIDDVAEAIMKNKDIEDEEEE